MSEGDFCVNGTGKTLCNFRLQIWLANITSREMPKVLVFQAQDLQVVFLPGKPPAWKSPKDGGQNYKLPLPGRSSESGENYPEKGGKELRKYKFCNFDASFP